MIILHVAIALASIIWATYTYLRPTHSRLHVSFGLIAATFSSGLYLTTSSPSHMIETCMMGIAYLAVVGWSVVATRTKLARS